MITISKTQFPLTKRQIVYDGRVCFKADATDPADREHHYDLDGQLWEDMGRPDVITVTIEPGDRLNVEAGS